MDPHLVQTRSSRRTGRPVESALVACDFCQRRKIRCTSAEGKCTECQIRNLECTFNKTSKRKSHLLGRQREKKEWNKHIMIWDSATSQPDSDSKSPSCKALSSIDDLMFLLQPRLSEMCFNEPGLVCKAIVSSPSPHNQTIKEKLASIVLTFSTDNFRFLINTLIAKYMFTCALKTNCTCQSPEFNEGIVYYSAAISALPSIDIDTTLLYPIISLLEDVYTLSKAFTNSNPISNPTFNLEVAVIRRISQ
ncbi:hypothetical protein DSO57_1029254 [Entomophthora muscae]|uniref:Uncharacterized protein n=1 Tax=Entomophthora muscae TaxID=34485 RepID=A0ACC2RSA4_9FUNG|nr:hypothetical protein DSO57_1029254 [Entomophthora muscae]